MPKIMNCKFCGETNSLLHEHHLAGPYLDEKMEICPRCHRILEFKFINFLLRGTLNAEAYKNECVSRYNKKYVKTKYVHSFMADKHAQVKTRLRYNIRTDNFYIGSVWWKTPW